MAAFMAGALLLIILQILAEQVKTGGNAEIDHYHVGRLRQVVSDRCACRRNIVLREAGAVIGNIDRKWLARNFFIPRQVIASHDLVGKSALPLKLEPDRRYSFCVDVLENELME